VISVAMFRSHRTAKRLPSSVRSDQLLPLCYKRQACRAWRVISPFVALPALKGEDL